MPMKGIVHNKCVCCMYLLELEAKPIFKQNKADVNSVLSFFKIGCHTKDKAPSQLYYLLKARD